MQSSVRFWTWEFACLWKAQLKYLSITFESMMLERCICLKWSSDIVMDQFRLLGNYPPTPPLNTYFSLTAKWWVRGGVIGGQFPRNQNWSIVIILQVISLLRISHIIGKYLWNKIVSCVTAPLSYISSIPVDFLPALAFAVTFQG